jgi:hypothetical protein
MTSENATIDYKMILNIEIARFHFNSAPVRSTPHEDRCHSYRHYRHYRCCSALRSLPLLKQSTLWWDAARYATRSG